MISQIYSTKLESKKANSFNTEPLFELGLSITNGIVSSKIYDNRDDFNFEIVNFPYLDGVVPRSPPQLIRFVRDSSKFGGFNNRNHFVRVLSYQDKIIDIINFVKHFLNFTTGTQS